MIPIELILIILFRFAGIQTLSAQVFVDGMNLAKNAIVDSSSCICGFDTELDLFKRLPRLSWLKDCPPSRFGVAHMNMRRKTTTVSDWLEHGGWEPDTRIKNVWCSQTFMIRRACEQIEEPEWYLVPNEPSSEVNILRHSLTAAAVRLAVIRQRGSDTGVPEIDNNDRAWWVREYYNQLRGDDRLEDWPRSNKQEEGVGIS
jgi:hypothetical protein